MDYYLYQGNQFIKSFRNKEDGVTALDKLYAGWKLNCPRNPALKLCYNGFQSVTIKEYPAS